MLEECWFDANLKKRAVRGFRVWYIELSLGLTLEEGLYNPSTQYNIPLNTHTAIYPVTDPPMKARALFT